MTPQEEKEILKGNILIGTFKKIHPEFWNIKTIADAKYHCSHDWLIPIVEDIEAMGYGFKMCRKVVEVYIDDTKEVILKVKKEDRMKSLWQAVVEFIKWYNLKFEAK